MIDFDTTEKYQSQIPAVHLLVALGYQPLSQSDAAKLRGNRLRNVILEDVLVDQLLRLNKFTHRDHEYFFNLEDAHEAIRRLKPTPDRVKGLIRTNQDIYDTLVLGTTITKTIDGDSKSYSFRYIDWIKPNNNVYHVTAEMTVEGAKGAQNRRCDVVAFVNGIPFIVIENKRPTESLKKAESQLISYQREENIPQLFHFVQLLLSTNRLDARYATVGTLKKFWQKWRDDEDSDEQISKFANYELTETEKDSLFSGDFRRARTYFEELAAGGNRKVSSQDRTIYALCRPERLLDLVRRFTVFDDGTRKIARHQQFFAVQKAMSQVKNFGSNEVRKGGVIWHTQGSGKSLTMVMLARALALDDDISNSRLVIVTDRVDLDRQIKNTFKSCEMEHQLATSGTNLKKLIRNKAPLVTTIVNKFDTALRLTDSIDQDSNLFVLIDESHRSQSGRYGGHGQLAMNMRRLLPKACYLGFTGTPLLQQDKNTIDLFGGIIHRYAIDQAVQDGAVVPLLYEGRLVSQSITSEVVDAWFEKLSRGLNERQKADLKRKYARMDVLARTDQAVRVKAMDVSEHFMKHWKDTGYKAQLIAPTKAAALVFKEALDEIGDVTSEIIISPPQEHEGDEDPSRESQNKVRKFWADILSKYGTEHNYNERIIKSFKSTSSPDILIVVSKLLTGFDAPRNTVLYICKSLKDHSLLQAIARVNRLYEDEDGNEKKFGYIIDYEGLLGGLDKALSEYSALDGYSEEDLGKAVTDIREEISKLPQVHGNLWNLFSSVRNKRDMEAFERHLADEALRARFYEIFRSFSRSLHLCLASEKLYEVLEATKVEAMKNDWKKFYQLRHAVRLRYQEIVDIKEFEPQILKLLDDQVIASPAETVIEPVNINDPDSVKSVVEETSVSEASKADRIASATRRTITEKLEEDPAFYRKFSDLLEEMIRAYQSKRISEKQYLEGVLSIASKVTQGDHGGEVPELIKNNRDGQAFFGILDGKLVDHDGELLEKDAIASVSVDIIEIILRHRIVDMWSNEDARNELANGIDDYFFDVLKQRKGVAITEAVMDDLQQKIIDLARARFPG